MSRRRGAWCLSGSGEPSSSTSLCGYIRNSATRDSSIRVSVVPERVRGEEVGLGRVLGGLFSGWRFSRPCSGLRQSDVVSKRGTAVLEAPEERDASDSAASRRVPASPERRLRRDLSEDFADPYDDDEPVGRRRGVRVRFRGLPTTKWGRIFAGCGLLLSLGVVTGALLMAR